MSPKKLTCNGTSRQIFICRRPRTPPISTPPPYILYTCTVYSILIHTGKGESWTREKGREATQESRYRSQSWVESTNKTRFSQEIVYLLSINTDKLLPQSPITIHVKILFRWRHFALPSISLIFLRPNWCLTLNTVFRKIHLEEACAQCTGFLIYILIQICIWVWIRVWIQIII